MGLTEISEALIALNQLKDKGIIEDYAIGGGYAVIYHQVPYSTYDLDIFAVLDSEENILTLTPVYDFFRERGNKVQGEYIYAGEMAVQILPNISPLADEAVRQAEKTEVAEIPTKVIGVEHLIALSLVPFRITDKYRISRLIETADRILLDNIIDRFGNEENQLRKRLKSILGESQEIT